MPFESAPHHWFQNLRVIASSAPAAGRHFKKRIGELNQEPLKQKSGTVQGK